jgi:hypothetical protein
MDQKIRSAGWNLTGIIAIVCGIITLPLSIALVLSRPAEIWWLGIILFPTSVFLIYSGIKTLYLAKKEKIETAIEKEIILNKTTGDLPGIITFNKENQPVREDSFEEKTILAHWKYSTDEWNRFMKIEKKDRKTDMWIEIVLLILLGALLIKYSRDASWLGAFAASIPIAFLIAVLRFKFNLFSISFSGEKKPETIVTDNAIMVNGHYNRFKGQNIWLGNVVVKDFEGIDVLEITYCWNTRGGITSEEIRVPVPNGKMNEALEVEKKLLEKIKTKV